MPSAPRHSSVLRRSCSDRGDGTCTRRHTHACGEKQPCVPSNRARAKVFSNSHKESHLGKLDELGRDRQISSFRQESSVFLQRKTCPAGMRMRAWRKLGRQEPLD